MASKKNNKTCGICGGPLSGCKTQCKTVPLPGAEGEPAPPLGDMAATDAKPDPRNQQTIPGTQPTTDDDLDELAVPLMHLLDERGTMDDKIGDMRTQLHNRMVGKKVTSYQVEDGPLSATFKPTETMRLSIRIKREKNASAGAPAE